MNYFYSIIFLSFYTTTFAQGLIEITDSQVPKKPKYTSTRAISLPNTKSLKNFCPTPQAQEASSCVGMSMGFAAMTIEYAQYFRWNKPEEINKKAFSAEFIYNQIKYKGDCELGTSISKAGNLMKTVGNVPLEIFNDAEKDCHKLPTAQELQLAQQWKIREYQEIFAKSENPKRKLYQIKKSIANNKPVIVGLHHIPQSFRVLKKHEIYKIPASETEFLTFGHAAVVVGYDQKTQSVELMNSWGTEWGNNGFCRISYDDFSKMLGYGYQIIINTTPKINQTTTTPTKSTIPKLEGAFLLHPITYQASTEVLGIAKVKKSPFLIYELDTIYDIGEPFKLTAQNLTKGNFIYLFSIQESGTYAINFPAEGISALIPDSAKIIFPPDNAALYTELETDYLCVLYSEKEITKDDLEKRVKIAAEMSGSIYRRIEIAFQDVLVRRKYISYKDDEMHVQTKSGAKGSAIFLVVAFYVK